MYGRQCAFQCFGNKRRIVSNDLVVIFPFQLAAVTEISDDFSMTFLKVSKNLFMDTISGVCIPTLDFSFICGKISALRYAMKNVNASFTFVIY